MIDDHELSEMLRRSGDVWTPAADPAALARAEVTRAGAGAPALYARPLQEGEDAAVVPLAAPPGTPQRRRTSRVVQLAVAACLVGMAIAIPLVVRSHGGQKSGTAGAGIRSTAHRLPAGFGAPSGAETPGMSCTTGIAAPAGKDFCMVVGSLHEGGSWVPAYLVMRGGSWEQPRPLPPATAAGAVLQDVACASPSECVGVGRVHASPHAPLLPVFALYDGTAWHPLAAPPGVPAESGGTAFRDDARLTCSPTGSCLFLYWSPNGLSEYSAQLSDGTWTRLPGLPTTRTVAGYEIVDVSCPASNSCYATAQEVVDGGRGGMVGLLPGGAAVLNWDGTQWTNMGTPGATSGMSRGTGFPGGIMRTLGSISCPQPGVCYVTDHGGPVGRQAGFPQTVDRLTDGTWSVVYSPKWPPAASFLSCPSAESCLLTGATGYPGMNRTQRYWVLAGGKWAAGRMTLPSDEYLSILGDASCTASGHCYQLYGSDTYHAFAPGTAYVLDLTIG